MIDANRVAPRIFPEARDADMLSPDYLSVFSVLFAFSALYLQSRTLAWTACFVLASSLLTRKKADFDKIQTIISFLVSSVVLFIVYTDPTIGNNI